VRVLSRRPRPPSDRSPTEWVRGDLRSGRGVDEALSGVDAVVHCATTHGRGDLAAMRNLTRAALRAGTPHLLYVSIVGIDQAPGYSYFRAKLECERLVAESGLPWTTLRATQFHDLIVRSVEAQRWLPVAFTLGGGVRLQPVDAREVGVRLAELALAGPAGRVADMAGPEIRNADELTRAAVRAAGRRRRVVGLRLPGKTFRAVRGGALLAPDHATGTVTFEEFLARRAPEFT
jgi:uncharacterized protein YbjT (DUF2867 family)